MFFQRNPVKRPLSPEDDVVQLLRDLAEVVEKETNDCVFKSCKEKFNKKDDLEKHVMVQHLSKFEPVPRKRPLYDFNGSNNNLCDDDFDDEENCPTITHVIGRLEPYPFDQYHCRHAKTKDKAIVCSVNNCLQKFTIHEVLENHLLTVHELTLDEIKYARCYVDHVHIFSSEESDEDAAITGIITTIDGLMISKLNEKSKPKRKVRPSRRKKYTCPVYGCDADIQNFDLLEYHCGLAHGDTFENLVKKRRYHARKSRST